MSDPATETMSQTETIGQTQTQTSDPAAQTTTTQTTPSAPANPNAAFYETFTDEGLKTDPSVQKYKSVEDLARGYVNAVKRLGHDPNSLITLPKGPDDVEGYKSVFKALGAPENVDGYQIKMEGAAPEDVAAAKEFAAEMFAKGPYPAAFVAAATDWFTNKVAAQNEDLLKEAEANRLAGEATLKQQWGQAYEHRKAEIGKLLNDIGGPDLAKELDGSTFGDSPKLAIFLGKILDKMAEPGPRNEQTLNLPGGAPMTPAQHQARAREMQAHPAFLNASHPQHKDVVQARNDALRAAQGLG